MSDKLLVEVEMLDGRIADSAVPGLLAVAKELLECGVIEISDPVRWNEQAAETYRVRWHFEEEEPPSLYCEAGIGNSDSRSKH